jgi:hypothetical protein
MLGEADRTFGTDSEELLGDKFDGEERGVRLGRSYGGAVQCSTPWPVLKAAKVRRD